MTTVEATSPNAERWPDVARIPRSGLRTAVARLVTARALPLAGIRVHTGTGTPHEHGDTPVLWLRDPDAFHARLAHDGLIGFGESYMAGEWDSPDLVSLLTRLADHYERLVPRALHPLRHVTLPRRPASDRNTRAGARRHISHHYDLSNDLFALFLDRTMTYSSALFSGEDPRDAHGLARAQERKIDRLLDSARVEEGTELLEIGTGWGELAVRAARRGARVTSITLSTEQRDLARARVAEAGMSDRVDVRLCDYRDATGSYDAVVSCEMIEAVGEKYWTAYVTALDRLTRPGGRVALQCITMEHAMMRASRGSYTWMHKYVFPGGLIPSITALRREFSAHTRLRVAQRRAFGRDYADTLAVWRRTFVDAADQVADLGFDPVFHRMWTFYLAYCEAGFRSGIIDVEQITLEHPA
ncbi:cyclopropane-fatty-acyl-phospholipid synthase family protein [Nocardiopsis sp. JB363]|uniref:SAM-dependent methyltransferase n=1 Tax=Nocardiopsis sp. JB363 TaxID=1434837 RepID=UPI000979EE6D|nr:cyclopropane-fatty-acyl-phospholipid synthase family protein [Nocardiopsis sp. JB363]SIO84073.1 S-adenosyl-L-methionine dependent methyltransferase, similar to cyclopropane-fatty-acyl-phospholipid synthase [Nocardiopsis sp. JB363]